MKFRLQLVIEEDGRPEQAREISCLTREELSAETLGLRLEEGKQILSELQAHMVACQVEQFIEEVGCYEVCQKLLARKDSKQITMRTLYGKLKLNSPRFKRCRCRGQQGGQKSFSPLAERLPERTTPELKYLQTKWAALASYGMSVRFMEVAFPLQTNTFAFRQHVAEVATRLEEELGEEQLSFIEGIPLLWEQMPDPEPPVTVGIDGGFIHARDGDNRKAGWFEVIVGKSQPEVGDDKRFAFVNKYDEKPKRRLVEILKQHGYAMRQTITFLTPCASFSGREKELDFRQKRDKWSEYVVKMG